MNARKLIRVTLVAVAALIGALFAVGAMLGVLFEVQGFGTPPGGPRTGYILGQAAQLLAGLAAPVIAFRLVLPEHSRWWRVMLAVAAAVPIVVVFLGLGLAT